MAAVTVTDEEITQFDRMVLHRAHRCFVAKRAPRSEWSNIYGQGGFIGSTGLTIDDLLQFGRMMVLHQIRYYRCFGDRAQYGAGLPTLIQSYLDRKFINYSDRFRRKKRGYGVVQGYVPVDHEEVAELSGDIPDPETLMLIRESIAEQSVE